MAALPIMFNNLWDEYSFPFGVPTARPAVVCASLSRPKLHHQHHVGNGHLAKRAARDDLGENKFEVIVDVHHFEPKEIDIKMKDGFLIVEGKHEEKEDEHGYSSRHFLRRYKLPKDVDSDKIMPILSSDGMLTLRAPLKSAEPPAPKERVVPITHTGKPARKEEPNKLENKTA